MTVPPTPRQLQLLRFIAGYQRQHGGISPSRAECSAALGFASKGAIQRMIGCLEERGLIRALPGRARAIEVLVDLPTPQAPDGAQLFSVPWHYKTRIVGRSLRQYPTFAGARSE